MSGLSRERSMARNFSLTRLVTIGLPSLLLGFILFRDIPDLLLSPFAKELGRRIYLFAIPLTFIGVVVPVVIVLWSFPKIARWRRDAAKPWPASVVLAIRILAYLCFALVAIIPFAVDFFFELFFPFSVLPLTAAVCGLLWLPIGARLLRKSAPTRRTIALAAVFCILLLVKFADWNSRRPFLRDLFQIRAGMTVEKVHSVMAEYMPGSGVEWPPIWDDKPKGFSSVSPATSQTVEKGADGEMQLSDSIVFTHSNDGMYNADWGVVRFREGVVDSVEFMPD